MLTSVPTTSCYWPFRKWIIDRLFLESRTTSPLVFFFMCGRHSTGHLIDHRLATSPVRQQVKNPESWRILENIALSSFHEFLRNRQVGRGCSNPPPPHTHTNTSRSVTVNAKTTVHCSPDSSV